MATQQIQINDVQTKILKDLVKAGGKVETKGYNGNTIKALDKRGLVKISENKKGTFVAATAKAKKVLN